MPNVPMNITELAENFVREIVAATEAAVADRIQATLASAFGASQPRGAGKSRQAFTALASAARRSRPKQLCPVPGCNNPAAPVFGMVCAKHKDIPKTTIKKYREQRKAQAAKAPAGATGRKPARASAKLAKARKLQGQYLGALKSLNEGEKAKVKAVARDKGVADALKLAMSLKAKK
jgi:hypothetical protein